MAEAAELGLLSGNFAATAVQAWAVAVFSVCMCMFLVLDADKQYLVLGVRQIPTLSLTGAYQPMQAIFSLGLSWLSVGTAALFSILYFHLEGKIDDADRAASSFPTSAHSSHSTRHHLRSAASAASSESLSNNDNGTASGELDFVSVSSAPDTVSRNHHHQQQQQQQEQRDAIPPPAPALLPPFCCFTFTARSCRAWNLALFVIGIAFSFFMALVGAIPLTLNDAGHGTVAIFMFILGVVHLVLYHFSIAPLDQAGDQGQSAVLQKRSRQTSVRYVALGLIVPLNVVILVTVFVTFLACDSLECRDYVVQTLVVMEFTTAVGLLVYVESFRSPDFGTNLLLVAKRPPGLRAGPGRARGVADCSGMALSPGGSARSLQSSGSVCSVVSQSSLGGLELAGTWASSGAAEKAEGREGEAEDKSGEV